MKATTYIKEFKKENGTEDIMKIYSSEDILLENNSEAAIICAVKRTTKEILDHCPLRFVVYIYRELLDDLSVLHFEDYKEACDYALEVL